MSTRRVDAWLLGWLRAVAPREWADSVEGDLLEDAGGRWHLIRVAARFSAERARSCGRRFFRSEGDGLARRLRADARMAARTWLRTPAAAIAVVLTLAVGIGANAAVFSVVNGVLLKPLPYPSPDSLVTVTRLQPGENGGAVSSAQFGAWSERRDVLSSAAAYQAQLFTVSLASEPASAEPVHGLRTSASLFDVLGVQAVKGRVLARGDEDAALPPVAIVSWRYWRSRLGGDTSAIGRRLIVDGRAHEVIGVMPAGFDFPSDTDLWIAIDPLGSQLRGLRVRFAFLTVIGRLHDGLTPEGASAALGTAIVDETGGGRGASRAVVSRYLDAVVRPVRPLVLIAACAVGFVLLIACANVASLLVVREAGRRRELAVRRALGASSLTLVREASVEVGLLGFCGAAAGVGLAWAGIAALRHAVPPGFPRIEQVALDLRVVLFVSGISAAATALFGVGPTAARLRAQPADVLRDPARGALSVAGRRHHARGWMVAMQMALSVVLLTSTGLLLTSFVRLTWVDRGFDLDHVQVGILRPALERPAAASAIALREAAARVRSLPGVQSAALADGVPIDDSALESEFLVDGGSPERRPRARVVSVGPSFFETLRIRIVAGRALTNAEVEHESPVAVVSEAAAHRYLGGRTLGRFLAIGGRPFEVVGVASDVRTGLAAVDLPPTIYRPIASGVFALGGANFITQTTLLVKTAGAGPGTAAIRAAIAVPGSGVDLIDLTTLEDRLWRQTAGPRFYSLLFIVFAAAGALLVAVGIYGLTAHLVASGTREIAIRLALGAERRSVVMLVLRQGLSAAAAGGVMGLAASLLINPLIAELLVGISTQDPRAYAGAVAAAAITIAAACVVPARRASHIQPMRALKDD